MSAKTRFCRITRPIKYRRLRLLCERLGNIRHLIIYYINYILYKLKILNRYSYRDNVENLVKILPQRYTLTHPNIKATVLVKVFERTYIVQDYFYYKKKGAIKKTLELINHTDIQTHLVGVLEDIRFRLDGQEFYTLFADEVLPTFRFYDKGAKSYELDVSKIKSLRIAKVLYGSYIMCSKTELDYYYDLIYDDFKAYFDDFNINSILVERGVDNELS